MSSPRRADSRLVAASTSGGVRSRARHGSTPTSRTPAGRTPPVLTYDHSDGCSISGGVPYRGSAIPELEPAYVYSDYCNSTIWALDVAGGRNLTLLEGFEEVTAVRTGPDGEIYVLERGGTVHRLIAG